MSNKLLLYVARGDQEKAEELVKTNPQRMLESGVFEDYSGRKFECSAFEYAYWANDRHMCWMLKEHMTPKIEAEVCKRLNLIEEGDDITGIPPGLTYLKGEQTYRSKCFDFDPLIHALQHYIDHFETWKTNKDWAALNTAWLEIGLAQRDVPAHVAQEYCRKDRSFHPTPSFKEHALPRTFNFNNQIPTGKPKTEDWFPLTSATSGLGFNLAITRCLSVATASQDKAYSSTFSDDLAAIRRLHEVRSAEMSQLREELNQPHKAKIKKIKRDNWVKTITEKFDLFANERVYINPKKFVSVDYDRGEVYQIPQDVYWHETFNPLIENHWYSPDQLSQDILSGLVFTGALLPAARQLLNIDYNEIRALRICAQVLLSINQLHEAEKLFQETIRKFGKTPEALIDLSTIYEKNKQLDKMYELIWEALTVDPNRQESIIYWVKKHKIAGRLSPVKALIKIIELPNAWRAEICLAKAYLERTQDDNALICYKKIFSESRFSEDAFETLCYHLQEHNKPSWMIEFIAPRYDEHKHAFQVGINLLKAYLLEKDYVAGIDLLNRLYRLDIQINNALLNKYKIIFQKLH